VAQPLTIESPLRCRKPPSLLLVATLHNFLTKRILTLQSIWPSRTAQASCRQSHKFQAPRGFISGLNLRWSTPFGGLFVEPRRMRVFHRSRSTKWCAKWGRGTPSYQVLFTPLPREASRKNESLHRILQATQIFTNLDHSLVVALTSADRNFDFMQSPTRCHTKCLPCTRNLVPDRRDTEVIGASARALSASG